MHDLAGSAAVMPWAIADTAVPLRLHLPAAMAENAGDDVAALAEEAVTSMVEVTGGDTVAVIRVSGLILPRVHPVYERYGYAVSCEALVARIEAAAATAAAVVLLFDSPGGSAAGVAEAATRIAAVAGGDVPVVAVADYLAASAAYWLASACTALVVSPSAMIGSVGVRLLRPSYARALDAEGVDLDALYRGEGKLDYVVWTELDDAGRERLQRNVDAAYSDFVAMVSTGRGVPRRTVENDWGAQLCTADTAVKLRLADEKRPASDVVARLGSAAGRRRYRNIGAIVRLEASVSATVVTDPDIEE